MSDKSKIEWTDATWNPVTGCTKVSEGCRHCYAMTFAERFRGTPGHYFEKGFDITFRPDKLDQPLQWKRPRRIFVNSMSDLFHPEVPDDFIYDVWVTMSAAPQHTFQILTKRPERMREWVSRHGNVVDTDKPALKNVWLGVSVENQKAADERIPLLLQTPAAVRFLSCEPLLWPVDLSQYMWPVHAHWPSPYRSPDEAKAAGAKVEHKQALVLSGSQFVDWVIVGGESGPGARPMHPDWARSLRDQCQTAGVSFFYKQWGEWLELQEATIPGRVKTSALRKKIHTFEDGTEMIRVGKDESGRLLDGREWNEIPGGMPDGMD